MSDVNNLTERGLEPKIFGIAPNKSVDLESYKGTHIPHSWDIVGVTGDILMCEYADEDGAGDYVDRDGILVNPEMTRQMWRVAKIIFSGPGASEQCQPGAFVMFANSIGVPMTKFGGHNFIFLNEARIFCFVKPKKNE